MTELEQIDGSRAENLPIEWEHLTPVKPMDQEGPAPCSPLAASDLMSPESKSRFFLRNIRSVSRPAPFQMFFPESVDHIKFLREERGKVLTNGQIAEILLKEQAKTDPDTVCHELRVEAIAVAIGKAYGLKGRRLRNLRLAAKLHDIGKAGVPEEIVKKTSGLTEAERKTMEDHPILGRAILHVLGMNKEVRRAVYQHHEKESGEGYPNGLKGNRIGLLAKIISLADVADALTDPGRLYREPESLHKVILYILRRTDRNYGECNGDEVRLGFYYNPRVVRAAISAYLINPRVWKRAQQLRPLAGVTI